MTGDRQRSPKRQSRLSALSIEGIPKRVKWPARLQALFHSDSAASARSFWHVGSSALRAQVQNVNVLIFVGPTLLLVEILRSRDRGH